MTQPSDARILTMSGEARANFWSLIDTSGGPDACHPWTGNTRARNDRTQVYGYFVFHVPYSTGVRTRLSRHEVPAHRAAYVLTHGLPPEDRPFLPHTCDMTLCCNVAHLTPNSKGNARIASHCIHGHALTPDNTYLDRSSRRCVRCRRESNQRSRAALVAAASAHRLPKPNAKTLAAALALFGSFTATAKVYGVSDVAVRKWCEGYGISGNKSHRKRRRPKKRKKVMS